MVGTVSAARRFGGRTALVAAAAAFAAGLGVGAALIFGALGALGAVLQPGRAFLVAAAVLAAAAVISDVAGLRVRPQVRFQVPEPWRRSMPLPRALFLYGVLLGTGVTTFVPAAAGWALLPLCVGLGSVPGAIVIGLSFAAGRALPVLVLVARGGDEGALAERPQGLRALRVLAAGSLAIALVAGEARAATPVASPGGDPSVAGADLVWQEPGLSGFLLRDGEQTQLPGTDPALGGANIAWRSGDTVTVATRETLAPTLQATVPGVEKLAVSDRWLVYRVRLANGSEQIRAFSLADPDEHDGHQPVAGGGTTRPPVARPRRGRLPPGDARREPPALLRPRYRKAPGAPLVAKGATAEPGPDRREAALRARLALLAAASDRAARRQRPRPRPVQAAAARGPGRRPRARPHDPG